MTRNALAMKTGNRLEIIDLIRRQPLSRADIARVTGLTRAAVTIIVDSLIVEGLVIERVRTADGRSCKPILLEIAEKSMCFMGVDITRTGWSVGILDLCGKIACRRHRTYDQDADLDSLLPAIRTGMQMAAACLPDPAKLMGIGISVPGPVDIRAGIVLNPPNCPVLRNQPILDKLRDAWPCGLWLDNNAAARALYEKHLGKARDYANFATIIVDTGVGSGLVLDGRIFRGAGYAGEIGHTSVDIRGASCACGQRGCLEMYAAIPAVLQRYRRERPELASWPSIVDLALSGDGLCQAVIREEAAYLAHGIANATNLLDLEAVVLTGDIGYKPELLLSALSEKVQAARITSRIHDLEIIMSPAHAENDVASAAVIALEKFLAGAAGWPKPQEIHTQDTLKSDYARG